MRLLKEKKLAAMIMAVGTVAIPLVSKATTATWIGGGANSNWDTSGNWNPSEPNAVDDVANFVTAGSSATLDVPVTLGLLNFTANATTGGADTLTFQSDDGTNPGILPAIDLSGAGTTATISAPMNYVTNSNVFSPRMLFDGVAGSSGTTLNINGGLSSSGTGIISFDSGNYNQGAGSVISPAGGMFIGGDGGTAVLNVNANISDAGVFILGNEQTAGISPVSVGTVNQYSGTVTSSGTVRIGQGFITGSATYTPGVTASEGTYNLSGGTFNSVVSMYVGSSNGMGTLNVTGATSTVTIGGELQVEPYAGSAPGLGGSGTVTLTDGTITVNNSGTGTALPVGHINPTAQSSILINGSTSTSGGRLVVTTGSLSIANQNSSTLENANGANGAVTIQNGGTASIGAAVTVGGSIPGYEFASPNTGTLSISGTTPGSYTSKFSVGTTLGIGASGATGTFLADESDTVPITVGSATSLGVINIGTGGFFSSVSTGTTYNGGNGSMSLSGDTVLNLNSSATATTTVLAIGASIANTVAVGSNLGSIGSLTLSNNAVLNVNTTGNTNALNAVIGNGVANNQGDAGSGTLTLQNNSQLNLATGNLIVGSSEANGTLNIGDSAHITLSAATASLIVGTHGNSSTGSPVASLLQSGTSLITAPSALIGNGVNGTATISGGTLDTTTGGITLGTSTGAGGTAGTIGNGTLDVTGGIVEAAGGGNLTLSAAATGTANEKGTLNLQGGLVEISGSLLANGVAANSLVNFTGGELQAGTITPTNFTSSVSQSALPVALQQTSNALVQTNTSSASLLHAATQNMTDSGGYVLLAGTAQADTGNTMTISGLTSVNSGTIQGGGTFSTSPTAGFGINGTLTVAGPGIVNLNGPSLNQSGSSLAVTGGTVNVSAASATPSTVSISSPATVNLNGSIPTGASVTVIGKLNLATGLDTSVGTLDLGSLSIGGSGQLNIANNTVYISYAPGHDPISSIAGWVQSGYGSGTWAGAGIMSTTAQANLGTYGIGYADSADLNNPAGLPTNTIEIAYTLLGDANLDHKVNGSDFTLMAASFNDSVTNGWDEGDFNYSGTVNGDDFVLLADNFNDFASESDVSAADLVALDSFAAANGISLTSVPEPASTGLLTLGVLSVLARRRQSRRSTAR